MKFIVMIWGYLNLFPILTPFVLFGVLWLVMHFFRTQLDQLHSGLITIAAFIFVGFATYQNFEQGPEIYSRFLEIRGIETDAAVVSVTKLKSVFSSEDIDEIEIRFQNQNGEPIELTYTPHTRRFYQTVELPIDPPEVGNLLRIRYFPDAESGFIILTNPIKSSYGAKLACTEAKRVLSMSEKAFKFDQFPGAEQKVNYRKAIKEALDMNCLDFGDRDKYRDILSRI